jgi:hypothetical protein
MKKYFVIQCGRCGLPQYVLSNQTTRKCPGCNYQMQVHTTRVVKETDDFMVAQTLVKYLKLPETQRDTLWDEIAARKRGKDFS